MAKISLKDFSKKIRTSASRRTLFPSEKRTSASRRTLFPSEKRTSASRRTLFPSEIRQDILTASYKAKACHIGSALSCVEILIVLYSKILKKKDIFVFSKASGVSALYAIL